jgi:hypothetical protein
MATRTKPGKPRPDFPLYAHAAGYWAKRIRGKIHYFGPWADPDAALAKYLDQRDDLYAGRKPRQDPEAITVKDLANAFLNHKQALLDSGELSPRTFADYLATAELVVEHFGKSRSALDLGPDDFTKLRNAMAKRSGPISAGPRHPTYPIHLPSRLRPRVDRQADTIRQGVQGSEQADGAAAQGQARAEAVYP